MIQRKTAVLNLRARSEVKDVLKVTDERKFRSIANVIGSASAV
jgi:hypothetical protein